MIVGYNLSKGVFSMIHRLSCVLHVMAMTAELVFPNPFPTGQHPLPIIPQLTPAASSHLIGISAAALADGTDSDIFYLSAFVWPNIQQL